MAAEWCLSAGNFICCHASLSSAAQALHLLCQVGRVGEEQGGGKYAVLLNLVQWPVQWIVQLGLTVLR